MKDIKKKPNVNFNQTVCKKRVTNLMHFIIFESEIKKRAVTNVFK